MLDLAAVLAVWQGALGISSLAGSSRAFYVLRHLALNLLRQEKIKTVGVHAKRFIASVGAAYLQSVLVG